MPETIRKRLASVSTVEDVVQLIEKSKKIVVITGAGISVSCGIPDFRSKSGLYNTLDCAAIGIPSAELLFDLEFFKIDPLPFYKYCPCLIPSDVTASPSHRFIGLLEQKKKLLRNYTQNVDGIERRSGITNVIECHGSMNDFQCLSSSCKRKKTPLSEVVSIVQEGKPCYCECGEVLKPTITFFGESLPHNFNRVMKKDVIQCDLILVMGTSLKVGGSVHEIMKQVAPTVPQILINKDAVTPPKSFSEGFDVSLLGACDDVVEYLCCQLEWDLQTSGDNAATETKRQSRKTSLQSPSKQTTSRKVFEVECVSEELRQYAINPVQTSGGRKKSQSTANGTRTAASEKSCKSAVAARKRKVEPTGASSGDVYERKFAATTSSRRRAAGTTDEPMVGNDIMDDEGKETVKTDGTETVTASDRLD